MFRNIDWGEYGGAGAMSLLSDFVESGKVPAISNIKYADYYVEGAVVLADLAFSDHLHGVLGGALDGAAIYAAGDMIAKALNHTVFKPTTTGTGASVDYVAAPARSAVPVTSFSAPAVQAPEQYYGDIEGFHEG